MVNTFLPIENNLMSLPTESLHLLKIIDMLEFLLHAQQEYKAGNRCSKVMSGLKYGGVSLKRRINAALNALGAYPEYDDILEQVTILHDYYNRQCCALSLADEYYV